MNSLELVTINRAQGRCVRCQDLSEVQRGSMPSTAPLRQLQRYAKDQPLFVTGEISPGIFVLKTGRELNFRRSGRGSYRSSRRSISPLESSVQSARAIIKITLRSGRRSPDCEASKVWRRCARPKGERISRETFAEIYRDMQRRRLVLDQTGQLQMQLERIKRPKTVDMLAPVVMLTSAIDGPGVTRASKVHPTNAETKAAKGRLQWTGATSQATSRQGPRSLPLTLVGISRSWSRCAGVGHRASRGPPRGSLALLHTSFISAWS